MQLVSVLGFSALAFCVSATNGMMSDEIRIAVRFAYGILVIYDEGYDDRGRSLAVVSCSDGVNGLITKYGWSSQGQIPRFPFIGGSSTVGGFNSPNVCSYFSYFSRCQTLKTMICPLCESAQVYH